MRIVFFLMIMVLSVFAENNVSDWVQLGLTESDFNNQMATVANNIGFTVVFLICFLAVLVMRK